METAVITALISAAVAIVSAGFSAWKAHTARRDAAAIEIAKRNEERLHQKRQLTDRYREPLVSAAYDLQSRCYNIVEQGMVERFMLHGTEAEREYAVKSTAFVFCEYLCWTEIIRREINAIDLSEENSTRKLRELQMSVRDILLTDSIRGPFRIFAADQRGIGERMIDDDGKPIGYAAFSDRVSSDPPDPVLTSVVRHAERLASELPLAAPRLLLLQNLLINMLDYLDPDHLRYPGNREKIGGTDEGAGH